MQRPPLAVSNGLRSALPQGFSPEFPLRPSGDYAYRFDDLGRLLEGVAAVAPCRSLIVDELERIKNVRLCVDRRRVGFGCRGRHRSVRCVRPGLVSFADRSRRLSGRGIGTTRTKTAVRKRAAEWGGDELWTGNEFRARVACCGLAFATGAGLRMQGRECDGTLRYSFPMWLGRGTAVEAAPRAGSLTSTLL